MQNKPPMFGDYEAQRHWMELTNGLPLGICEQMQNAPFVLNLSRLDLRARTQ